MAEAKPKHEPIRQSVRVDCPIEEAFRLFTEGFAEWWPLASYSIAGEEAESCAHGALGGRKSVGTHPIRRRTRVGIGDCLGPSGASASLHGIRERPWIAVRPWTLSSRWKRMERA